MHALMFEVWPKDGHEPQYFDHVNRLKPALEKHDGLVWLDRFRSLSDSRRLLSHQLWRDDAAIAGWRRDRQHKAVQRAGREVHFEDYRIRVAHLVVRIDGDAETRFDAGLDSSRDAVLVVSGDERFKPGLTDPFSSINRDGVFLELSDGPDMGVLEKQLMDYSKLPGFSDGFVAKVMRDYSLNERVQVPEDAD